MNRHCNEPEDQEGAPPHIQNTTRTSHTHKRDPRGVGRLRNCEKFRARLISWGNCKRCLHRVCRHVTHDIHVRSIFSFLILQQTDEQLRGCGFDGILVPSLRDREIERAQISAQQNTTKLGQTEHIFSQTGEDVPNTKANKPKQKFSQTFLALDDLDFPFSTCSSG